MNPDRRLSRQLTGLVRQQSSMLRCEGYVPVAVPRHRILRRRWLEVTSALRYRSSDVYVTEPTQRTPAARPDPKDMPHDDSETAYDEISSLD